MNETKLELLNRLVQIKIALDSVNFVSSTLDDLVRDTISDLAKKEYIGDSESLPKFPENSLISCNKV